VSLRDPDAAEQAGKRTAGERLVALRARLTMRQPFLASLALHLDLVPVVDDRLRTACTDGERIFFDARFLAEMGDGQATFVLAHEVWHAALGHFLRQRGREAWRWNLAIDHEVNVLLEEAGFELRDDCVLFPGLKGRPAEEVYALIDRAACSGRPEPIDRHIAIDQRFVAPGSGVVDPDFVPRPSREHAGRWRDRLVAAAGSARGHLPAGHRLVVDRILAPVMPWRRTLARFALRHVRSERTWLPPARRHIHRGLLLPGRHGEHLDLAIALDTSGSTRGALPRFLGEVAGVVRSFASWQLRLLQCDAEITADQIFDPAHPFRPEAYRLDGGGGTDFRPVFERLQHNPPAALLFFTDGDGAAPDSPPGYPVLWALAGGTAPVPWGECLELPADYRPHRRGPTP